MRTYFEDRRAKGFNVVQCVVIQMLNDKNTYGDTALMDADIARLNVTPGSDPNDDEQYDYWDHVNYVFETAAANGIYVAAAATWRSPPDPSDETAIVGTAVGAKR